MGSLLAEAGVSGPLTNAGTVVSIVVAILGAVSGALGTYLARRYKIRSDNALTEQQQLFAQYRRLVDELQQQVGQLRGEVMDIQNHYLECRVENAGLKACIAGLEVQVAQLRGKPADGQREDPGAADRG